MSKCYLRQQTARGTIRPNVHPETHQRCVASQRGSRREVKAATVADSKTCPQKLTFTPYAIFLFSFCKRNALHALCIASQRRITANAQKTCYGGKWILFSNRLQIRPSLLAHGANSMNRIDSYAFGKCLMAAMLVCYWVKPIHRHRHTPPSYLG